MDNKPSLNRKVNLPYPPIRINHPNMFTADTGQYGGFRDIGSQLIFLL